MQDQASGNQPASWREASPLHRLGGRAEVLTVDLSHAEINKTLGRPGRYTEAVDGFLQSLGLP